MSAVYSIFTSPTHPPVPDHLPTLIVTPHGRPAHVLYTYLHTNTNRENYLLTPSDAGDLCVAKLFPPNQNLRGGSSSNSHGSSSSNSVKCEASRNLRWSISNTGIQNPVYKLTLPNPDVPQQDQPLFQVSRPNPNATWWTLFYFTYAGHLIPPKRVEFGRIQKNSPESGGGTRVSITGKTDEEKAVWKTLGEGNEDMVEWIVLCASLTILDDEIILAAEKAGLGLSSGHLGVRSRTTSQPQLQPPSNRQNPPSNHALAPRGPPPPQQQSRPPPQQRPQPLRRPSMPNIGSNYARDGQQAPPVPNGYSNPEQQRATSALAYRQDPPQQQRPQQAPQQQQQQQQQQAPPSQGYSNRVRPPPIETSSLAYANGPASAPAGRPGPPPNPYGRPPPAQASSGRPGPPPNPYGRPPPALPSPGASSNSNSASQRGPDSRDPRYAQWMQEQAERQQQEARRQQPQAGSSYGSGGGRR